ncbi:chain B, X-Ray Structure Of Native Peptide Amidase From Stenotrophomonas Maltophilia At 1.4 A [Asticcacaulis biprosthecium C19]|uniref:Chain B, X-Ray Structure Of Native Peptide Amidase From Stenotrophomonas Maltophilia At 1.4 A n=1 Tax=Asticcacaulis biprosthecium C19 TaxID=715226 RepID=F4QM28_9CAUL|nr:amidase [Asticcacaulis biprosthecium]EGF93600.1 chain B, X-Ray Structure Of Native Peptide Amidase From Stenotrophomonas Maltophilia At 1.4 A [Asticcacaulis biprosthecium C19]
MYLRRLLPVLLFGVLAACSPPKGAAPEGASSAAVKFSAADALAKGVPVAELQAALQRGDFTAVQLTQAALDAIKAKDGELHSVIVVNPDALAQAKAIDEARKAGKSLGPLMGIPVLIKDNVETADNMATTAGSLALKDNITRRDAPVVARLRAGGAIILGKTNLSEWANIRSTRSMSGWSAVGGLVANPHDKARTACGSSSGSGAAVAANFAPLAVGTETDGSVTCPASMNGLVGLKPTVGLVSRTHVVPISHTQDTPGPMGRSVSDVAAMMTVMAGSDPADGATMEADKFRSDYAAGLSKDYLKGVRVGVLRDRIGSDPKTAAVFEAALKTLTKAGAVLIDIKESQVPGLGEAEWTVLQYELKADLNAYLATTPAVVKTRTLADVIAFNTAHAKEEMPFFGQEFFEQAQTKGDLATPEYVLASVKAKTSSALKLDGLLKANNVTVLVSPTYGPAWMSDPIWGDQYTGPSATQLPATSGYPHLTVPMGDVQGLPVGLSFIGPRWSEAALLKAGYAFEQAQK